MFKKIKSKNQNAMQYQKIYYLIIEEHKALSFLHMSPKNLSTKTCNKIWIFFSIELHTTRHGIQNWLFNPFDFMN